MPSSVRKSRVFSGIALAVLLALAFGLRARGLDSFLPYAVNRDGWIHVKQLEAFQGLPRDAETVRALTVNPHLLSRLGSLWPRTVIPDGPRTLKLDAALDLAREPWMHLRIVSLLLSLLAIPGTYLLARRFLGRAASLFAAGLLATSLLHVLASGQEKAHGMVTSFLLLALLAAMRLRRKGDAGSYLASGGAAALAIGSLHNGLLAPPALLVAWLRREPRVGRASGAWILAPLLMLAGAIAVFWPFVLARAAPGAPGTASPTSSFLRVFTPDAYRFERVGVFLGEIVQHDPVLVGLAGIGILVLAVTAIRSRDARRAALRGDIAVVLAFAVPYSLALLFLRSTTARYVVAIAPVLAVLGGHVFTLAAGFRRDGGASPRWRVGLAGTGAIVCLVLAFLPVGKLAWIRGRPDTLASGASWLARHAEPGDGIVMVPVYDLPLLPTEAALAKNLEVPWKTPWGEFLARGAWACVDAPAYGVWIQPGVRPEARQALLADPATYFERYRARWVVLATPDYDRVYHAVRAWLTREARLEARFSPLAKDDGRNVHAMYQNDPGDPSAWSVLEFGSLGPTVEIYRLP